MSAQENPNSENNPTSWNALANNTPVTGRLKKDNENIDYEALEAEARLKFYQDLTTRFLDEQTINSEYRDMLIKWFTIIIAFQVILIDVIVIAALHSPYIKVIFDFLNVFISATVVELLGGLFIIVHYVYNHNVYSLLETISKKIWNTPDKKKKKQKNKNK